MPLFIKDNKYYQIKFYKRYSDYLKYNIYCDENQHTGLYKNLLTYKLYLLYETHKAKNIILNSIYIKLYSV